MEQLAEGLATEKHERTELERMLTAVQEQIQAIPEVRELKESVGILDQVMAEHQQMLVPLVKQNSEVEELRNGVIKLEAILTGHQEKLTDHQSKLSEVEALKNWLEQHGQQAQLQMQEMGARSTQLEKEMLATKQELTASLGREEAIKLTLAQTEDQGDAVKETLLDSRDLSGGNAAAQGRMRQKLTEMNEALAVAKQDALEQKTRADALAQGQPAPDGCTAPVQVDPALQGRVEEMQRSLADSEARWHGLQSAVQALQAQQSVAQQSVPAGQSAPAVAQQSVPAVESSPDAVPGASRQPSSQFSAGAVADPDAQRRLGELEALVAGLEQRIGAPPPASVPAPVPVPAPAAAEGQANPANQASQADLESQKARLQKLEELLPSMQERLGNAEAKVESIATSKPVAASTESALVGPNTAATAPTDTVAVAVAVTEAVADAIVAKQAVAGDAAAAEQAEAAMHPYRGRLRQLEELVSFVQQRIGIMETKGDEIKTKMHANMQETDLLTSKVEEADRIINGKALAWKVDLEEKFIELSQRVDHTMRCISSLQGQRKGAERSVGMEIGSNQESPKKLSKESETPEDASIVDQGATIVKGLGSFFSTAMEKVASPAGAPAGGDALLARVDALEKEQAYYNRVLSLQSQVEELALARRAVERSGVVTKAEGLNVIQDQAEQVLNMGRAMQAAAARCETESAQAVQGCEDMIDRRIATLTRHLDGLAKEQGGTQRDLQLLKTQLEEAVKATSTVGLNVTKLDSKLGKCANFEVQIETISKKAHEASTEIYNAMSALNAVEKKKAAVEASIEKAGNMLEWNKEAATNAEQKKTEAQKAAMEAERQRKEEQRAAKEAAHLRKIEEQKALAGREGLEAERARVKGELDAVRDDWSSTEKLLASEAAAKKEEVEKAEARRLETEAAIRASREELMRLQTQIEVNAKTNERENKVAAAERREMQRQKEVDEAAAIAARAEQEKVKAEIEMMERQAKATIALAAKSKDTEMAGEQKISAGKKDVTEKKMDGEKKAPKSDIPQREAAMKKKTADEAAKEKAADAAAKDKATTEEAAVNDRAQREAAMKKKTAEDAAKEKAAAVAKEKDIELQKRQAKAAADLAQKEANEQKGEQRTMREKMGSPKIPAKDEQDKEKSLIQRESERMEREFAGRFDTKATGKAGSSSRRGNGSSVGKK